jgi:hypothetical protein
MYKIISTPDRARYTQAEARGLDSAFRLLREDMVSSVRDALQAAAQPKQRAGSQCVLFQGAKPLELQIRHSVCVNFTFTLPPQVGKLSAHKQVINALHLQAQQKQQS